MMPIRLLVMLTTILASGGWELVAVEETVVRRDGVWRYLAEGNKGPGEWAAMNADDRKWPTSTGMKLPGKGGSGASLWRHRFNVEDLAGVDRVRLSIRYHDGVVVFLNGVEWVRANMPPGFIDASTPAARARGVTEAREFEHWEADRSLLEEGGNVLAVAVHRAEATRLPWACELELVLIRGKEERESGEAPERAPSRPGRRIEVTDKRAVAEAAPGDWKVTAFALEEEALEAYGSGDWKMAAARYAQSQLAYVYAFRGSSLDGALKHYLLAETELSREFLTLLSRHDDHEDVYELLGLLQAHDAERFRAFPRLAMAMALVYDQRPPWYWPHSQVSRAALPRRLPDPVEAFDFWVDSDEGGETLFRLGDLMIEELTYVVDVVAPLEELRWAQEKFRLKRESVVKLYWTIRYDHERFDNGQTIWLDDDYHLPTILERGGICADQAYFMTQVAKAHGVPCITVTGMVEQGRHAWVGYMEEPGEWNFQAGRNAESFFVSGRAFDPQTWRRPLDHELAFLKQRLAMQPKYRLSKLHSGFAKMALREGDAAGALTAATESVRQDKRNLDAWEILLQLTEEKGAQGAAELERLCRNGAKAFREYPDLEAGFLRRLAGLLEERGDLEGGQGVRREIIRRNHRERPDLALAEAARELHLAMEGAPVEDQVRLYKRQVSRFREAGLITGQRMVEPFVRHLIRRGEVDLAKRAIAYARNRLQVSIPEQLDRMLTSLEERLPREAGAS